MAIYNVKYKIDGEGCGKYHHLCVEANSQPEAVRVAKSMLNSNVSIVGGPQRMAR
jgi:hypothetical protein